MSIWDQREHHQSSGIQKIPNRSSLALAQGYVPSHHLDNVAAHDVSEDEQSDHSTVLDAALSGYTLCT